jgi:ABC-type glycerol-3-phosphate transport system permease component
MTTKNIVISLPASKTYMSFRLAKLIRKTASVLLLVIASTFVALPFIWMISTSLQPDLRSVYTLPPNWIPNPPTWANYPTAWTSANFNQYLFNSVLIAVIAMTLQVISGCMTAYAFSWIEFPGRDILFMMFLAVLMIPGQVTIIPNYIILSNLGWINTYQGLIIPMSVTAFGSFLIRQAFLAVPRDLFDASVIDGAGHWQILRMIMLPLSKPMIFTFALLSFNWRWNDYFWVLIMTNTEKMRTLPVGLVAMRMGSEGASQWQIIMAGTVMVIAPIMILFAVTQRSFVEGIARTGLKGV